MCADLAAQKMDALSSMANSRLPRGDRSGQQLRPFLHTAGAPRARCRQPGVVVGAGVAELAAMGTATSSGHHLCFRGAPEVADQIESMGAQFVLPRFRGQPGFLATGLLRARAPSSARRAANIPPKLRRDCIVITTRLSGRTPRCSGRAWSRCGGPARSSFDLCAGVAATASYAGIGIVSTRVHRPVTDFPSRWRAFLGRFYASIPPIDDRTDARKDGWSLNMEDDDPRATRCTPAARSPIRAAAKWCGRRRAEKDQARSCARREAREAVAAFPDGTRTRFPLAAHGHGPVGVAVA